MVPRAGVEPATSPLGGVRSILLSYRGVADFTFYVNNINYRFYRWFL